MRRLYRALALLIALGVFLQAATIAYGWFAVLADLEAGGTLTADSELNAGHVLHGTVGMMVLPVLALVLFVVSLLAHLPGGVRRAGAVLALVVLQVVLALVSFGAPVVGLLHGANAIAIVGASFAAAALARHDLVPSGRVPAAATA